MSQPPLESRAEPAPRSVVDDLAEDIRAAIYRGTLHPGAHLPQRWLAQHHPASKGTLREALAQLRSEGLLQHDYHRGYFVARLSAGDVRQVYRMRRWLETELLTSLQWPDRKQLDRLAALQRRAADPATGRPVRDMLREELRLLIFGLSPEGVLLREVQRLWLRTDRFRTYFETEGDYALMEALAAADRDRLLEEYARERAQAEATLEEALVAMPALWAGDGR
ncbi:GntR family transcriptional regulator [Sphingomonas canadensis]|uniref:GntR family transcriptional regulator n=1 Tax=Sphingomonas canadensis TaxID=1219257 RepID=A0ABW3H7T5_9SPHN|nr:GntR family transcriptional regulator [Sphingomonas canadensis]MCW3836971.1 GntR family transcriptional regulator [Sphingomonas canadensis]